MAKHAAPTRRSPWQPFALAVVAALVLTGTGSGVLAVLRAVATGNQTISTGTLSLRLAPHGTFGATITGAAPGDTLHRFVTVTNNGTLAAAGLTLTATGTGAPELTTTSSTALRVSVTSCPTTWTTTGTTGSCPTTPTVLLDNTALSSLNSPHTLLAPTTTLPAGHTHHLRISLRIPDNAETTTNGTPPPTTVQGKTADITFTLTQDQRTSTTTSS